MTKDATPSLFTDADQKRLIYLAQIVAASPRSVSDEGLSELQFLVIKALDELSETRERLASLKRYLFVTQGATS